MVENFVFSQRNEENQPWYTFIMKKRDISKTAIVMKIDPFVLVLDPNALSRESLWIRLYKEVNPRLESIADAYSLQVVDLLHQVDGPLLKASHDRIIYPESLADTISNFPMSQARLFASASLNRAKEHIYGTTKEKTQREKELIKEISKYKWAERERKLAQKRKKPRY